jgi:hypothetical protein
MLHSLGADYGIYFARRNEIDWNLEALAKSGNKTIID